MEYLKNTAVNCQAFFSLQTSPGFLLSRMSQLYHTIVLLHTCSAFYNVWPNLLKTATPCHVMPSCSLFSMSHSSDTVLVLIKFIKQAFVIDVMSHQDQEMAKQLVHTFMPRPEKNIKI
jgi:phosphopantetheinyl transferase